MTDNNGSRAAPGLNVPEDIQDAILELIETCKEKNVDIPEVLGKGFYDSLSESRRTRAAELLTFSKRLCVEIESHKNLVSESPIVQEVFEVIQKLKGKNPKIADLSLRIKDGSFKIIDTIDDSAKEDTNMPTIETVFTGMPTNRLWKRLKRAFSSNGPTTAERYAMQGVNLYFEQGKSYLVLGAPRSGKSTLLRMIASILPEDKHHEVGGSVMINKFGPKTEGIVWSNFIGYIDQIDRLHPYLTVKETCEFAWRCRSGGTHRTPLLEEGPEVDAEIERLDKALFTVMIVLRTMGLVRVQDTFVGDQETVRGVSGGEKKRVTVSEMMVGGYPIMCMDEISTGLDAATTYDICKLLSEVTALTKTVKIVTLLQPPPETFALFDNLILLSEGKIIYSGPMEEVVPYFESLGYSLPDRMDVADWLQSLPTKDGAEFLTSPQPDEDGEVGGPASHLTSDQFHTTFYSSDLGKKILEELGTPFESTQNNAEIVTEAVRKLMASKYRNNWYGSLKLLGRREFVLWWRDKRQIKSRIGQDLVMGIIVGTVFWQSWDETTSVLGILFQSLFFISMGAMLKIPAQYAVRGILYKQQDANFYPTWTYVVGRSIASIPISVIDGLLYGTIVYWFVGLAWNDGASIGNYFMFIFMAMFTSISIGLLFSLFPAITTDRSTGQAAMSVTVVFLILFCGFTVQPDLIPNYWIWVYWINLFAWSFRGLVVNEYQSGKYDFPSPQDPDLTQGQFVLTQMGFVDRDGVAYGFEWAAYSILFALLLSVVSVIGASILLDKVRFATGKSLSADNKDEDENAKIEAVETELPFQKVNLTFKDIHYTVTSSIGKEKIQLLKGIDGVVEAGKMTALMGSSGAGKTTLMDVLALRKTSGEITGEVSLNGHPQEELSFRRCTGYVEQFDTQSAQLTIRETCEFSARLRLESTDPAVTPESTAKLIDQTIEMLELTPIQHFLVGTDATGGLSFEQKKRLSIAVELVGNPSIIFLDEPTSGLDARAAAIVMRGLKRIALTGRAVCSTIHQPSIAIFNSFDSLLLLKRGGEVVFYGELGDKSSNLIEYFEGYSTTPLIQPGENPATWMLTTIGAGSAGTGNQFDYAGGYRGSKLYQLCEEKIASIEAAVADDGLIAFPSKYATTLKTQVGAVFRRTWKVYWRSPSYNRTRILLSVILSLLIGSVFVTQRVPTNEAAMNARVTTVYLSFLLIAVNGMNTVLAFFEAERNMYYRHKMALMYDTPAISFSYTVAEIPFLVGTCFIYTTIFYFMVGFSPEAAKYFFYYLFMLLCMANFTYLGQMFVSLSPDAQIAQGYGGVVLSCTGLFAGVLIRPQNIPNFWIFMYWLMPGHYILEGLLMTQFDGDDQPIQASPGSAFWDSLDCDSQIAGGATECFGTASQWVNAEFAGVFSIDNVPVDIIYLVALLFFTRFITVWALGHLNFRST